MIKFRTDEIDFEDEGTSTTLTLRGSLGCLQRDEPNARLELLVWALISEMRGVSSMLQRFSMAGHDQADAVREQTTQMQQNINDAKGEALSIDAVLEKALKALPDAMQALATGSGRDIKDLLGGSAKATTVVRPNGG